MFLCSCLQVASLMLVVLHVHALLLSSSLFLLLSSSSAHSIFFTSRFSSSTPPTFLLLFSLPPLLSHPAITKFCPSPSALFLLLFVFNSILDFLFLFSLFSSSPLLLPVPSSSLSFSCHHLQHILFLLLPFSLYCPPFLTYIPSALTLLKQSHVSPAVEVIGEDYVPKTGV